MHRRTVEDRQSPTASPTLANQIDVSNRAMRRVRIRSDRGPEFIAKSVQDWIAAVGSKTAYIEPGSPWENDYYESFNAKLRDELLNGEVFYTLKEASVVNEQWRKHYNGIRPHSSLGYHPPAPEVVIWPTEPSGSVPSARPAIVTRPAIHER